MDEWATPTKYFHLEPAVHVPCETSTLTFNLQDELKLHHLSNTYFNPLTFLVALTLITSARKASTSVSGIL